MEIRRILSKRHGRSEIGEAGNRARHWRLGVLRGAPSACRRYGEAGNDGSKNATPAKSTSKIPPVGDKTRATKALATRHRISAMWASSAQQVRAVMANAI